MTAMKVAFVGLGMMGVPMASRIAGAGHRVYVADTDSTRIEAFTRDHGAMALTVDVLPELDVLITMLPNSKIVEQVLLGSGTAQGYSAGMRPGSTVIDMSSSEPAQSKALGARLETAGIHYIDAPVSGGVKRAVEGALAILVGGTPEIISAHRELLALMGGKILHVGDAGAGHAAKALNNYVSAAGLVATVEALQIGARFGIDPATLTDVLNASSGQTNTSLNKVRQFMLNGTFGSGFALQLMAKDLGIAEGLADSVDYPMTMGKVCVSMWRDAAKDATPATDHTEMYRLLPAQA
ncbi:NAD(P)-dependent oxidoreductase [Cupriavidus sp. 8B]